MYSRSEEVLPKISSGRDGHTSQAAAGSGAGIVLVMAAVRLYRGRCWSVCLSVGWPATLDTVTL